ncbi:MAG TPA: rhomboid family intramembrane serine protease [Longimicrobium sp.]|nr:rhomboid family intramembrane serine protease [Longimicrobium sp.]
MYRTADAPSQHPTLLADMPYRDSYAPGMTGPHLTPWVRRLMIALTAVFLVLFVSDDLLSWGLTARLVLVPSLLLEQPWSLLTFPFVHRNPLGLLFTLLTLFFFGGSLEDRWGGRAFLKFCAVSAAGGALLALVLAVGSRMSQVPVMGFTGVIYGLLLALAMFWPDMEISIWGIIPVKAKWLALVAAAIGFIISVQSGGIGLAHLGAFGTAFLYLKSPWAPHAWGDVPAPRPVKRQPKAVVQWAGKKDAPSAPSAPRPIAGPPRSARAERELLDDVDRILDKISAEGLAALSDDERKRLDEVSRRYRTN